MAKKRKSDATRLDEVDRTMHATFCAAANSLSQLYAQAMSHQKLSFQAGERHGLEKLYQLILRQQEEGSRVATVDIVSYLQKELDYGGAEDPPASPRPPFQQHSQTASQLDASHATNPFPSGLRSVHPDQQAKNNVFSNALSSPVRRSLQHYQGAHQGRDTNSPSSMDRD